MGSGFNGRYILNEKNEPMPEPDLMKWAQWFETAERHVGLDEFPWGCVSTVFLGLDHNFSGMILGEGLQDDPLGYRPILWETAVFGGPLDHTMYRYDSWEDALYGHAHAVAEAKLAFEVSEIKKEPDARSSEDPGTEVGDPLLPILRPDRGRDPEG
jgi:hypothetical protein